MLLGMLSTYRKAIVSAIAGALAVLANVWTHELWPQIVLAVLGAFGVYQVKNAPYTATTVVVSGEVEEGKGE